MTITEVTQKVQLVEGEFTISEANDVVSTLIDQKINFHKIQRLSSRGGNEACNVEYPNNRIAELMNEKQIAKKFLAEARAAGCKVRINGTLEITFED